MLIVLLCEVVMETAMAVVGQYLSAADTENVALVKLPTTRLEVLTGKPEFWNSPAPWPKVLGKALLS